jgi:hypothetical protein
VNRATSERTGVGTISAWRRFRDLLGRTIGHPPAKRLIAAFLIVDLSAIAWFVLARLLDELEVRSDLYELEWLRMTADNSLPEWVNYLQLGILVLVFSRLARRRRVLLFAAFAWLFAVVLADDAFGIHETAGRFLADTLELPAPLGLRPHDVGELVAFAVLGLIVVSPLLLGLRRADPASRPTGMALLIPLGCLLLCAVVVDQLYHGYAHSFFGAGILLDVVEDGGEMLAITVTLAVAIGEQLRRPHR